MGLNLNDLWIRLDTEVHGAISAELVQRCLSVVRLSHYSSFTFCMFFFVCFF